jgi:hypothetical protein
MKSLRFILALLLVLSVAPACKKEKKKPVSDGAPDPGHVLLVKEYNDEYTAQYSYDSDHKLVSVLYQGHFDGDPETSLGLYTIEYNVDGTIMAIQREYAQTDGETFGWRDVYSYSNGRVGVIDVMKRDEQTNTFSLYREDVYAYPSENEMDVLSAFPNNSSNWFRIRYKTTNGNTTEYDYYGNVTYDNPSGVLQIVSTYSNFDDKHYAYSSLPEEYDPGHRFVNNAGMFSNGYYTETISCEYDSDGYPVKKTVSDGTVLNFEYQKIP